MTIIYEVVRIGFELMEWLIIGRVLMSWLNISPNNRIAAFIYEVTEPILKPLRALIPRGSLPLDFSPILAIILLNLVQRFILRMLLF